MRWFATAVLLVLLLIYTAVFVEAFTKDEFNNGTFEHGTRFALTEVTCATTAGGTAALSATDTASAIAVTFHNIGATNLVNVCPVAAGNCDAAHGYQLLVNETKTFEHGVRGQTFSCLAGTAGITLEIVVESY